MKTIITFSILNVLQNSKELINSNDKLNVLLKILNKFFGAIKCNVPEKIFDDLGIQILEFSNNEEIKYTTIYWKDQPCCFLIYKKFNIDSMFTFGTSNFPDFIGTIITYILKNLKILENINYHMDQIMVDYDFRNENEFKNKIETFKMEIVD